VGRGEDMIGRGARKGREMEKKQGEGSAHLYTNSWICRSMNRDYEPTC